MVWLSYKPYDHLYTYRIPGSCRIISKTSLQIPSHVLPKRNLSICYVAADDDDNTTDFQKTSNPMTEILENASMETTEAKDPLTSGVGIGFVLLLCTGNMQAVIDLLKNAEGIIPGFFKMIIDHIKSVMLRENFPIGHIIKIDDKDELVDQKKHTARLHSSIVRSSSDSRLLAAVLLRFPSASHSQIRFRYR
ncbi:unnamed protein product [Lactuca saligna]|uniref:Uncharacterized protein n=1 Tax=Lactuca saligna TaxID=75948 RepID=A0AA36E195_LACSI|nr:unnamed protein product [Lactuca saligna]